MNKHWQITKILIILYSNQILLNDPNFKTEFKLYKDL